MYNMYKRTLLITLTVLLLSIAGFAAAGNGDDGDSWTGWITDTQCGANGAKEGHGDCAKRCAGRGEKLALIDSEGHLFVLEPQEKAAESAGEYVKVTGTLADGTIQIEAIEAAEEQKKEEKEAEPGK